MKTIERLHQDLLEIKENSNDANVHNEANQLLCITGRPEFMGFNFPEEIRAEIEERVQYLLEGKKHPKRRDLSGV